MAWVITYNLEPVYVDDDINNDNSCPVPCEDCGCRACGDPQLYFQ